MNGEFTLWSSLNFNFETILQAHDSAIRSLAWSHNDAYLISGDNKGLIKYWQSNMSNLKEMKGHNEALRGLAFSPSDAKFASCSDDGLIKIWDFQNAVCERTLQSKLLP